MRSSNYSVEFRQAAGADWFYTMVFYLDEPIARKSALALCEAQRDEAVAALRRLKSMTVAESPMGRIVRNALALAASSSTPEPDDA